MANPKNIRLRALLLALVLLACGTMALGGTFATSVDKPGEEENLQDSDFNVSVQYHDGTGYHASLMKDTAVFTKDVPWCPGYTKIVYLKVTNDEAFPVECTLNMNVSENGFKDMLTYTVIENLKPDAADHPSNWKELAGTAAKTLTTGENNVFGPLVISSKQTNDYALAVHMSENATNEFQAKQLAMTFQLRINADYAPGQTPTK